MGLKDFTTEELRAEISRRYAAKKAEREAIPRCRLCVHFGEITYYGTKPKNDLERKFSDSCQFHKTKNGKYYKTHQPSQLACEHFERKE